MRSTILQRSARRGHGRRERGFTFLEVMLVIVILGLALAITLPNMRPAGGRATLEQATRRLIGMVRYARAAAISSGTTVEVFFDFENNRIELRDPKIEELKEQDRRGFRRRPSRDDQPADRPLLNLEDYTYTLPDSLAIHQIATYAELMMNGGKQARILFYPDGRASRCTVTLRAARRDTGPEQKLRYRFITIEIYHATGGVHSYVGLPEELEDVTATVEPLAGRRDKARNFTRLGRRP